MEQVFQLLEFINKFNPESNGEEALFLTTNFIKKGNKKLISTQTISLQSYSNSACFNLVGVLTPDNLRKFADQLDEILVSNEK